MNVITIEKKKYVLIPQEEFKILKQKSELNLKKNKRYSLEEGLEAAHKLIDKWAKSGK